MSEEENYLDNLLKSLDKPQTEHVPEEVHTDEEFLSMLGNDEIEALPEEGQSDLSEMDILPEEGQSDFSGMEALPEEEQPDFSGMDVLPEEGQSDFSGMDILPEEGQSDFSNMETLDEEGITDVPDIEAMAEEENDFNVGGLEMPEIPDIEAVTKEMEIEKSAEISIDGLDEAIAAETETQIAGQLDMDAEDSIVASENRDMLDDVDIDEEDPIGADDDLDDVLSMLDNDAELAEINDMLKKSDNNEPIVDDMMSLLNQMADDEAASVNAGVKNIDDDDGGVPLPELPAGGLGSKEVEEDAGKKKGKKKKAEDTEEEEKEKKEPGKLGKFFNMLTEDLVPEPTEEELAAEKEAKAAKKQANLTKKEEEKAAKEEAKKAKAEEKEAEKKAKTEAAQQKKKEKEAAKAAKKAAKEAKKAAEGPRKRIPPKKLAVGAVFGATVGGAIIISTNILSTQGYLQSARKAYYNQDYKTVYQAMYGMNLDDTESDGLIQARSEVILKMQRRYDSYQTNLKMGRKTEALDALLQGISTYDHINADAQMYGVLTEVDAIKDEILNTLSTKYGLDESAARELINNEDALSYTVALNSIINGQ